MVHSGVLVSTVDILRFLLRWSFSSGDKSLTLIDCLGVNTVTDGWRKLVWITDHWKPSPPVFFFPSVWRIIITFVWRLCKSVHRACNWIVYEHGTVSSQSFRCLSDFLRSCFFDYFFFCCIFICAYCPFLLIISPGFHGGCQVSRAIHLLSFGVRPVLLGSESLPGTGGDPGRKQRSPHSAVRNRVYKSYSLPLIKMQSTRIYLMGHRLCIPRKLTPGVKEFTQCNFPNCQVMCWEK